MSKRARSPSPEPQAKRAHTLKAAIKRGGGGPLEVPAGVTPPETSTNIPRAAVDWPAYAVVDLFDPVLGCFVQTLERDGDAFFTDFSQNDLLEALVVRGRPAVDRLEVWAGGVALFELTEPEPDGPDLVFPLRAAFRGCAYLPTFLLPFLTLAVKVHGADPAGVAVTARFQWIRRENKALLFGEPFYLVLADKGFVYIAESEAHLFVPAPDDLGSLFAGFRGLKLE